MDRLVAVAIVDIRGVPTGMMHILRRSGNEWLRSQTNTETLIYMLAKRGASHAR